MTRHVFPRAALALAILLGALAGVRAQDGGEPAPKPPRPADPPAAAEPSAAPEDAKPRPPAVGEAFPASLPVRALPKPGATPDSAEEPAPPVTLAELRGEGARPVVLVFWSARCTVCKRYGDVLQKLAGAFGEKVRVVLVATGSQETPDAVRESLRASKLALATYLDPGAGAASALGVRVTPTAFLVDAEGVLRYRGPIDDDRRARSRDARELLRPAIDAVLAGKAVENGDVRAFGSALR